MRASEISFKYRRRIKSQSSIKKTERMRVNDKIIVVMTKCVNVTVCIETVIYVDFCVPLITVVHFINLLPEVNLFFLYFEAIHQIRTFTAVHFIK